MCILYNSEWHPTSQSLDKVERKQGIQLTNKRQRKATILASLNIGV